MNILSFLNDHITAIVSIVLSLIVLIITICKKKVVISDHLSDVLLQLPSIIKEAESLGVSGVEKFSYVFNVAINSLAILSGEDLPVVISKFSSVLNNAIEEILSTPQKKEIL